MTVTFSTGLFPAWLVLRRPGAAGLKQTSQGRWPWPFTTPLFPRDRPGGPFTCDALRGRSVSACREVDGIGSAGGAAIASRCRIRSCANRRHEPPVMATGESIG